MIDMHPPPAYIQIAQKQTPGASQPLQLVPSQPPQPAAPPPPPAPPAPPTATYATIIVTVVPPTGTVEIYVPGSEDAPVIFRGPKTAGEIRLNGPTAYVHLKNGATSYEVEYLSWREP